MIVLNILKAVLKRNLLINIRKIYEITVFYFINKRERVSFIPNLLKKIKFTFL